MLSTKQKTAFLEKYISRNYRKWFAIHRHNISGFRIDKKIANNQKRPYYSIIFQVKKKIKPSAVAEKHFIPPFFKVRFKDGKTRKIFTDIQACGEFRFHVGSCKKRQRSGSIDNGTVGVFLGDNNEQVFGLTNYHVMAWQRMERSEYYFKGTDSDGVTVNSRAAVFVEGRLNDFIDAAFIHLPNVGSTGWNILPDGRRISGYKDGPFDTTLVDKAVRVYSKTKNGVSSRIVRNSVTFNTGFREKFIQEAVSISRCTDRGDSGAAVMLGNDLLGIVTGADDCCTYVIPYYRIKNFRSLSIL